MQIAKEVSATVTTAISAYNDNISQWLAALPTGQDMIEIRQIMQNMQGQLAITQSIIGSSQQQNSNNSQVGFTPNREAGGYQLVFSESPTAHKHPPPTPKLQTQTPPQCTTQSQTHRNSHNQRKTNQPTPMTN